MVTPACLPLSVEGLPSAYELETSFDVSPYEFAVDPPEMRVFLVRPPAVGVGVGGGSSNTEAVRRAWALVVMRGMVAVRLAQGFQFVLRPSVSGGAQNQSEVGGPRRVSYIPEGDAAGLPAGAAEVLKSAGQPLWLKIGRAHV